LEALYELRGIARYVVASEQVSYSVENSNLTMTQMLQEDAGHSVLPQQIVRDLAIQGHARSGGGQGWDTLMAADMGRIDELKSALNGLVLHLKASMGREGSAIVAAYDATPSFNEKYSNMRDLWAFTHQLQERVQDAGVRTAVARVRSAQRAFMI